MLGEAQSNWITTRIGSILRISLCLFLCILALEAWITWRIWSRRWISTLLYDFFHLEVNTLFATASWVYCTHCCSACWALASLVGLEPKSVGEAKQVSQVYYKYHSTHLACTCVAPPWLDGFEPRNIWWVQVPEQPYRTLWLLPSILGAQEIEAHHLSDGMKGLAAVASFEICWVCA